MKRFKPFCTYTRKGIVRNFVAEGLRRYDSPAAILERIEKNLADTRLNDLERAELLKQKEKIEPLAKMMF